MKDSILLPYHLGRITTYIFLGVIFNTFLNLAFLFLPQRGLIVAPILILAGTIFLVSAFPILGRLFPWAISLHLPLPRNFVSGGLSRLEQLPKFLHPYLMGVVLGFVPCGLVVAALMATATATSPAQAALAMCAFGLGTMPTLIAISLGGFALKSKYPHSTKRLSQGLVVWSGLWLFAMAGMLLM